MRFSAKVSSSSFLLVRRDLVEVPHHLLSLLLLLALGKIVGLEPVENIVELGQHLLRHLLGAGLGQVLDALQHFVEVLLGDHVVAILRVLTGHLRLILLLSRKGLEIAGEGGAQFLDTALDVFGRCIVP
ncbi:MAG: hypothetical protein A49_21700 [Methyloceanibacter sp.]|nr:MAG: hypothetical protein A49_21700 [Methyloceanibacter sp.]